MSVRQCTPIYSRDSTVPPRFFWVCRTFTRLLFSTLNMKLTCTATHLQLICGRLGVLWLSFSLVSRYSLGLRSIIKLRESSKCWDCLQRGCLKWESNQASFLKRRRMSSGERPTALRAWNSIPGSTTRKNSRARSISKHRHWRKSFEAIQCRERT